MGADSLIQRSIDTVRLLSADGVEAAHSGHPGMPMGCADFAFTLWDRFLRHNPDDPQWLGRDRFVLSAGHGSMLLYSLLHLFGYDMTLEDLKAFRQWKSQTPGHPEYGHTPGVEVTTGPLSSGLATGVGMAIGLKQLAARMENTDLFDQRVFVLSSDGCMMEGTSHEACSIAGHMKLDNLVVFYDDNQITIEGPTSLAFSDDVAKRFESYGWEVLKIDGQNVGQIEQALDQAIRTRGKPVLIVGSTTIGHGAPNAAGSHGIHGAPLGEEELAATKKALGFAPDASFVVPDEVKARCEARKTDLVAAAGQWSDTLRDFLEKRPEKARLFQALTQKKVPDNILEELLQAIPEKDTATRNSGGEIMQRAAALVPALTGGAADLNPSTKTYLKAESDFAPGNRAGRNIHYGVRELGMGFCTNGLALSGVALPFCSTFTVFSDYMKPALRLAAIQNLHTVFVYTHDSVFVGEDGPTHQPIEHLGMLRSMPNITVIRPAESTETAHAWACALQAGGPVALFLTRQTVPTFPATLAALVDVDKGAYVLSDDEEFELILIATGSEVHITLEAAQSLRRNGRAVRVVSMPSWERFDAQDEEYRASVLPDSCEKRVYVEAGSPFGWERYVGQKGLKIGIDHFGDSAPYKVIAEKYGLTAEAIAQRVTEWLA